MFTVTIAADATPIDEGGTARFTVTLSRAAPAAGLAVVVGLSQEGEFATAALPGDRTVTVTGGATRGVGRGGDLVLDDRWSRTTARSWRKCGTPTPTRWGTRARPRWRSGTTTSFTVTIAAAATPIDEGGTARFTVTLSRAAPAAWRWWSG